MSYFNEEKCRDHGLDVHAVRLLVSRFSEAGKIADRMGLYVFGGSGTGSLRIKGKGQNGEVAVLKGTFDGGDGGDEWGDTK